MGAGEACGQAAAPAASGDTCELSTDCQEGYVCITQPDGTRQCSNNLAAIQSTEEAGADAPAMAAMDGTAPQGDSTVPPSESGAPPPQDSGSPPADTGSPPKDTGSPPVDTGSPPQDTGSPPQEAGGD
jgi:hypothetical protein